MPSIYTLRFAGVEHQAAEGINLFVPTGDYTYVIRDLCFTNRSPTATGGGRVWILTGTGQILELFSATALPPYRTAHQELRQELIVGEALQAISDVAPWSILVTGYRFTGTVPRSASLPAPIVASTHN